MSSLIARSLKDICTFTRASTATYCGRTGLLTQAAVDEPRLEYDPTTGAARGLLIEEARTNTLLRSQEFSNASWSKTRASVTADAAIAPDGTTSADRLTEDATASDTHYLAQVVAKASSSEVQAYSVSVFAQAASRSQIRLQAQGTSGSAHSAYALYDLVAGTAGSVTTAGNYDSAQSRIERHSNGWWRCVLEFRVNNDAQADVAFVVLLAAGGTVNYSGDNASHVYVWGAQMEKGVHATSYIPTTTAAVARSADVCEAQSLRPWFDEDEGTIYAEYLLPWPYTAGDAATGRRIVQADAGNDNDAQLAALMTGGVRYGLTYDGGVQQASLSLGAHAADVVQKQAYAWAANDVAAIANGSTLATDSSVTVPTGLTSFRIGPAYQPNGYIRRIRYWPRRLTDNELRGLVA